MSQIIKSLAELKLYAHHFVETYTQGAIVGLSGELGSGKTTFVRSVIEDIAVRNHRKNERVLSPSFVLHQSYSNFSPPVDHFDLYRMERVTREMLVELEYYEIVEAAQANRGFLFVEWPEQCLNKATLKLTLEIGIEFVGEYREFTECLLKRET